MAARLKEFNLKTGQSLLLTAAGIATAGSGVASEVSIKVTLPEIASTGPRAPNRPYVAIWLRKEDNTFASDLAVWYQIEKKERAPRTAGQVGEGQRGTEGQRGGDGQQRQRAPENPKTPGGARWLNEVRQWWADSGNQLQFPVDGVTSASRAAGTHEITFAGTDPKLAKLAPGKYKLMIEASREHGGEETLSIPFTWPAKSAQTAQASGKTELGSVVLIIRP
jgi:hypothetical protein